jgi:hypothetical protein
MDNLSKIKKFSKNLHWLLAWVMDEGRILNEEKELTV